MEVPCTVEETTLQGDHGGDVPSVIVECSRCGHSTESFGTGEASIRRCLVLLRQECPNDEDNWYYDEDGQC